MVGIIARLFAFTPPEQILKLQAKVASHEWVIEWRKMLASQLTATLDKSQKYR